ncbi:MAG: hypothetical protein M0P71_10830 [Melioribacteraceae bacterium]|nr:hypothetical protein [Melioribacteraceae bacterium]
MVKIYKLLLFVFISFVTINAQDITVQSYTDSARYYVGDYIQLHLELKYNKSIKPIIPAVKDSVKELEFIKNLPVEKKEDGDNVIEKHTFIFSKYDSAEIKIPPINIYYTQGNSSEQKLTQTSEIKLIVKKILVNAEEEIKDVKEPLEIYLSPWIIALIVVLIIILVLGSYYLYDRYKKKKANIIPEEKPIYIPAYNIALEALQSLEGRKLWQNGSIKVYHTEITEIIRRYIEADFNIPAMEITSGELMTSLREVIIDDKEILESANRFFENADMVKFARFNPMPKVNEEMMLQAYDFVKKAKEIKERNNGAAING